MTELEPTRTYSNLTATDELRRILDERGVEWWPSDERWNADVIKHWYAGLLKWTAIEGEDGLWVNAGVAGHNSLTPEQAIAATLGPCNDSCNCTNGERTDLAAENAALREQMERLVTLLRNDCDIDASWDGLRRFWSIELTEDGCLMRDRACKAEADNAKLRELVRELYEDQCDECDRWRYRDRLSELGIEVDA